MRVLVLGSVRPAHRYLERLGHDVALFMFKSEIKPDDVTHCYSDIHIFDDECQLESLLDIAKVMHANNPFHAVCCLHDNMQHFSIAIAEAFQLQFPVTAHSLETSICKYKTRQLLKTSRLDITLCEQVNSYEELAQFIEEHAGEFILKPLQGTGSAGIQRINSTVFLADVITQWQSNKGQFPAIIEQFLVGEEYSIECFSESGQHRVLAITEKLKDESNFVELGHAMPAAITTEQEAAIIDFIKTVLTVLQVDNGPSHSEVILTSEGPQLIETHTRMGGDNIADLVELTTGLNLIELTVDQSLGEFVLDRIPQDLPKKGYAAVRYIAPVFNQNTCFESCHGIAQAEQPKHVKFVKVLKKQGDDMGLVRHSYDRTAMALCQGDSLAHACQNATDALKQLQLHVSWKNS